MARTGDVTGDRHRIAVAGEARVDFVLERGGRTTARPGGGAYNAARTLGRMGLMPAFVGRLSGDGYGRALRAGLTEAGVALDGVVASDAPTTFARVELDAAGSPSYRFYLEATASAGLTLADARAAMPEGAAALHVGGLGLAVEPQAAAIGALVGEAGPETLVFVDPNGRPGISDPTVYLAHLHDVLAGADVVKASEADLLYLAPDVPPLQTARALLRSGPSVALVTHGARGTTVLAGEHKAWVGTPEAQLVDTAGAGDAFGAAWLGAWIADGHGRAELGDLDSVVQAARFAAAIAARTCERAGPEPPVAVRVGAEWCIGPANTAGRPPAVPDGGGTPG